LILHIQRSASPQFFANNQNGNIHLCFSLSFLAIGIASSASLLKILGFMLGGGRRATKKPLLLSRLYLVSKDNPEKLFHPVKEIFKILIKA